MRYHTKLLVKALDWKRLEDKEDASKLLRGKELQEAEQILASAGSDKDPQPTNSHRQYIAESRKAENAKLKRLTEERKKTNLRLRNRAFIIGGIAVCAIVTSGLAILFGGQVGSARLSEQQANETAQAESTRVKFAVSTEEAESTARAQTSAVALSRKLAGESVNLQSSQIDLSLLLGVQANRFADTFESRSSLISGINYGSQIQTVLVRNNYAVTSLAFSPDANLLAFGDKNGIIHLWNISKNEQQVSFVAPQEGEISSLSFSSNGKVLAAASRDGSVLILDVINRKPSRIINNPKQAAVVYVKVIGDDRILFHDKSSSISSVGLLL